MRKQTGEDLSVKKFGNAPKISYNKVYIPDRGDIVWVNFDPRVGHEQSGHRPALVISLMLYNQNGKAVVCPITSRKRGNSFEVSLPEHITTTGVILADQVKNIDWKERKAEFIEKVEEKIVKEVILRIKVILPENL